MSTETVSVDPHESTRKTAARIQGEILRKLADVTQEHAAACMGVSASTVSRAKDSLDQFCQLLAAIGMQVADVNSVVVDKADQLAMKRMAFKYLQAELHNDGAI